jgi:aminopeptidase YwaD
LLAINLDMVGDYQSKTCYSFYSCPGKISGAIRSALTSQAGFQEGEPWYQSDHMVFAQNQVPAMALTSSHIRELMTNITHTAKDVPDLVDPIQLVRIAQALRGVINCLPF